MTPLLARIEREMAVCTDPLQVAELLAERACYFARTGNFNGAREIAALLRRDFGDGRSVRISIWIMLIEGLVLFFESNIQLSRDRINRAYAISSSVGDAKLRALTGAWLAHMEFERARYGAMAAIVVDILDSIDADAHAAQSRLGLVLGDAFLYAGDRSESQRWYEKSRWHSTAIGDQASVGALMYNRAAFGLSLLRVTRCAESACIDRTLLSFIELELQSAASFQVGTGVTALTYLVDLCRARVAVLQGRLKEASDMLLALREKAKTAHNPADSISVDVDLAWCLAKTGNVSEANQLLSPISSEDIDRLDVDDGLIAAYAIAEIAAMSQSSALDFNANISVAEKRAAYSSDVMELRAALGDIVREVANRPSRQ